MTSTSSPKIAKSPISRHASFLRYRIPLAITTSLTRRFRSRVSKTSVGDVAPDPLLDIRPFARDFRGLRRHLSFPIRGVGGRGRDAALVFETRERKVLPLLSQRSAAMRASRRATSRNVYSAARQDAQRGYRSVCCPGNRRPPRRR